MGHRPPVGHVARSLGQFGCGFAVSERRLFECRTHVADVVSNGDSLRTDLCRK